MELSMNEIHKNIFFMGGLNLAFLSAHHGSVTLAIIWFVFAVAVGVWPMKEEE
jgi:hypothetical protein